MEIDFGNFADFRLKKPVGNMMENDEEDVKNVKNALFFAGHRKDPAQNGIIEQETDDGIRSFQKAKKLKDDGYLLPGGETEEALNKQPLIGFHNPPIWLGAVEIKETNERKKAILENKPARFIISENSDAKDEKPFHEFELFSEVNAHKETYESTAKKYSVDPDLVKAIAYMETTHGRYDSINPMKKSIRPMNVHKVFWKDLGYSDAQLNNAEENIDAGTRIIRGISSRVPNATIRQIATLYQNLSAEKVSDYGARVDRIYKEKPWLKE